jgi:tetratricopeptide (TPR) repeat protein
MRRVFSAFVIVVFVSNVGSISLHAAEDQKTTKSEAKSIAIKEAEAIGKQIEEWFIDGESEKLRTYYSAEPLIKKVVAELKLNKKDEASFMKGARSASSNDRLIKEILRVTQNGGSYKFLRAVEKDGSPVLVFRFLGIEEELNYHLMYLKRDPEGEIVMDDLYIILTGEMLSVTMTRIAQAVVTDTGLENQARATIIKDAKDYSAKMRELTKSTSAGNFKQALKAYNALPDSMQNQKAMLIIAINAAVMSESEQIDTLVKNYNTLFPSDPAANLVLFAHYLTTKKFAEAHEGLNQIQKHVGGDAYLDYLHGIVYYEDDRDKETFEAMEAAFKQEPTLPQLYNVMIGIHAEKKNYQETCKWLKRAYEHKELVYDFESSDVAADFKDLIASKEYKAYRAWVKKQLGEIKDPTATPN